MQQLVQFFRNPFGDKLFKNGLFFQNYLTAIDSRMPLSNGFEHKIEKDWSIVILGLKDIINEQLSDNVYQYKINNIYRYFIIFIFRRGNVL